MHLLSVSSLYKQQGGFALRDISFQQSQLQKIAIAGESGSGKSTLLKIIAGLVQPDAGLVLFEGKRVEGPFEKLIPGHPGIAYLSQHYELRNNYRMEELLEYANKIPEEKARHLYRLCRIDHLFQRKNGQLSGGERQRLSLAMLLTQAPRLLLLDEPFSNLDPIHKNILKEVLEDISTTYQTACLLTSHDPLDTLSWAQEIIAMKEGQIVQQAPAQEIYHHPVNEYVAGLFGSYNVFDKSDIALFPPLKTLPLNGKPVYLRPEQFMIVPASTEHAVPGKIQQVSFWGSYYEIRVLVGHKQVLVKTTLSPRPHEESVHLLLSPAH
jgi:iron(III) transport system ATP-binding protein